MTRNEDRRPSVDSDPGPAACGRCGDVYTKIGRANRGVCSECWGEIHTCPECDGTKGRWDDVCDDCACDHPGCYVSDEPNGQVLDRCVECDEVVNRGDGRWQAPLEGESQ